MFPRKQIGNSLSIKQGSIEDYHFIQFTNKGLLPPDGVSKLTMGALGPAAGVDVINPGGRDPSGRRIESVGRWDSCKVPDSNSCMGH